MPQCVAMKRDGERCQAMAVVGRDVCGVHGGSLPRGLSAHIRTGRYSRAIPARLRENYERAVTDAELLSLREDVALVESRIADLLAHSDVAASKEVWGDLRGAWEDYNAAKEIRDVAMMGAALARIGTVINRGYRDTVIWTEIAGQLELKRRLAESERKRLVDQHLVVSVEGLGVMMLRMLDVIKDNVDDPVLMQRLSDGFMEIMAENQPGGGQAATGFWLMGEDGSVAPEGEMLEVQSLGGAGEIADSLQIEPPEGEVEGGEDV